MFPDNTLVSMCFFSKSRSIAMKEKTITTCLSSEAQDRPQSSRTTLQNIINFLVSIPKLQQHHIEVSKKFSPISCVSFSYLVFHPLTSEDKRVYETVTCMLFEVVMEGYRRKGAYIISLSILKCSQLAIISQYQEKGFIRFPSVLISLLPIAF